MTKNARRRVVFDGGFAGFIGEFEPEADVEWLHTDPFLVPFGYWKRDLEKRADLFLGYSSASRATAQAVKEYLLTLNVRVLDWRPSVTSSWEPGTPGRSRRP